MRTIRFLLQKEFRQIFRNKIILAMILVVPAIQLMILPLAADYEVKNINISIVDNDHSSYSQTADLYNYRFRILSDLPDIILHLMTPFNSLKKTKPI